MLSSLQFMRKILVQTLLVNIMHSWQVPNSHLPLSSAIVRTKHGDLFIYSILGL